MFFKIFLFSVCFCLIVITVKPKAAELEKRLELEGIYRIQSPEDNYVVAVEEAGSGNSPLKLPVMQPVREDDASAPEQYWSIMTSGPPVARVAEIFNQKETQNTLTIDYGFVDTMFTRAWQVVDAGSGLAIFRNLGLCLTRFEEVKKVERSNCSNGKNVTTSQKWRLVFVKDLPTTNEGRHH